MCYRLRCGVWVEDSFPGGFRKTGHFPEVAASLHFPGDLGSDSSPVLPHPPASSLLGRSLGRALNIFIFISILLFIQAGLTTALHKIVRILKVFPYPQLLRGALVIMSQIRQCSVSYCLGSSRTAFCIPVWTVSTFFLKLV